MSTQAIDCRICAIVPKKPNVRFDVMVDGRFRCQLSMALTPGLRYGYDELRAYAVMKRPSLSGLDFELVPTSEAVFRN